MTSSADSDEPRAIPAGLQLMAHDIRSAVSDVIGGVRLMDQSNLSADARRQLERVQSASELLARLIEDMLADAPGYAVEPIGNLNLRRFFDDELRRWHGAAQGTGITVRVDRSGDVPEIVRLALLPLRRVVANLMSNALRHSGGTVIALAAEVRDDGALTLCVQDNGKGLPDGMTVPQEMSGRSETTAGSGMGLRIAAAYAREIGGDLKFARSSLGGARIGLVIPKSVWSPVIVEVRGAQLPDLRGVRMLVADDSGTNRLLVQAMLTRLGAECELARDGIEALNWLARERFDLALIDVEMPILSGIDVLRSERLRQARGIAPPTSLVAMTAYVMRDNREAILDAGADGIMTKPLGTIEAFGAEIQQFLAEAPDGAAWQPEDAPALSAATLSELLDAAGPAQQGVLLDRMREDLERVERSLSSALATGDLDVVSAQSHVLMSLSSAIGALPTQVTARRLNRLARAGDRCATGVTGKICLARLALLRAELSTAS